MKSTSLNKLSFTGMAQGCFLSSMPFLFPIVLHHGCLNRQHVRSSDPRAAYHSDAIGSQVHVTLRRLVSYRVRALILKSWFAHQKTFDKPVMCRIKAGSRSALLLSQASAILARQPALALTLVWCGGLSQHVPVLPAMRYTSSAQQIAAPKGPAHTTGHSQDCKWLLLLRGCYYSAASNVQRSQRGCFLQGGFFFFWLLFLAFPAVCLHFCCTWFPLFASFQIILISQGRRKLSSGSSNSHS